MKLKATRPRFRTRWRGYDRGEVDAFLADVADEYARLRPNVTYVEALLAHQRQCEATIQDLQAQLAARQQSDFGRNTRNHLEGVLNSVSVALRDAQTLLQQSQGPQGTPTLAATVVPFPQEATATDPPDVPPAQQVDSNRRRRRLAYAVVTLPVFVAALGMMYIKGIAPNARALNATPNSARIVAPTTGPVAPSLPRTSTKPLGSLATSTSVIGTQPVAGGLTIVLQAHALCWVATTLDGKQRTEYLLRRGEERMFHAQHEVVLRVGNAGALSLTVNGRATSPLGREGEVVTRQITPANYENLMRGPQHGR